MEKKVERQREEERRKWGYLDEGGKGEQKTKKRGMRERRKRR
jgi:hypothetical protein